MNNLLSSYQSILNHYKNNVVEDLKDKILGSQENASVSPKQVSYSTERSFVSQGTKNIDRYYQALKYGKNVYGLECNPSCVMYYLQSYGLIPKNIPRKAFEYLFTPLNPNHGVDDAGAKSYEKSTEELQTGEGEVLRPKENLFDNLFPQGAEAFLRGIAGGVFPHFSDAGNILHTICKNFYELSFKEGYKSLQKYLYKGAFEELQEKGIGNKYNKLTEGLDITYFRKHVILVGLAHYPPLPGHYCLIVNKPTKEIIDGIEFLVYPAGDPLSGKTFVCVPSTPVQDLGAMAKKMPSAKRLIYPNCAIGV